MARQPQAATVIATFLGQDVADVNDGRYPHGHTSIRVAVGDGDYYCAPAKGANPARVLPEGFEWQMAGSALDRTVYISKPTTSVDTSPARIRITEDDGWKPRNMAVHPGQCPKCGSMPGHRDWACDGCTHPDGSEKAEV
jgi:hypothetical protein